MINPFYWLEIRIRAREKRLWIIALFFLLSVFLIGGGILAIALVEASQHIVPGELGAAITYTLLFWHGTILIVMAPLASAGRLAQEREQRTLPALINTNVEPRRIVYGKLLGSWVFILWLSALVLPFLCIGALWGGTPLWKVVTPLLLNIVVSMVIASVSLGFSGLLGRSLTAYLLSGAFLLAWLIVLPILGSIGMQLCSSTDTDWLKHVIPYLCFYANPYFPPIQLLFLELDMEPIQAAVRITYCLVCWAFLCGGGILLARKGLKREVY
jgi:ABC-2 type transport system permease protein